MDAQDRLDDQIDHIENDDRLTDEEKNDAIHEEEDGFREHMEQFEAEQEDVARRFGF